HFDYSIEEQLNQETSIEQIVLDMETIKVNFFKTLMELDGHGIQNEKELPKSLTSHKRENYIANPTLMEIDPNKVSSEINIKINLMQEDEIAVPGKKTYYKNTFISKNNRNAKGKRIVTGSNATKIINKRGFSSLGDNAHFKEIKPIKNLFVGLKGKAKIEIESDETYSKAASPQKVLQINVLLQEIFKRLEIVKNNQLVLLVTDK
ncbi:42391_t:CDS:2, partial [Gigaspora margarita]